MKLEVEPLEALLQQLEVHPAADYVRKLASAGHGCVPAVLLLSVDELVTAGLPRPFARAVAKHTTAVNAEAERQAAAERERARKEAERQTEVARREAARQAQIAQREAERRAAIAEVEGMLCRLDIVPVAKFAETLVSHGATSAAAVLRLDDPTLTRLGFSKPFRSALLEEGEDPALKLERQRAVALAAADPAPPGWEKRYDRARRAVDCGHLRVPCRC